MGQIEERHVFRAGVVAHGRGRGRQHRTGLGEREGVLVVRRPEGAIDHLRTAGAERNGQLNEVGRGAGQHEVPQSFVGRGIRALLLRPEKIVGRDRQLRRLVKWGAVVVREGRRGPREDRRSAHGKDNGDTGQPAMPHVRFLRGVVGNVRILYGAVWPGYRPFVPFALGRRRYHSA